MVNISKFVLPLSSLTEMIFMLDYGLKSMAYFTTNNAKLGKSRNMSKKFIRVEKKGHDK